MKKLLVAAAALAALVLASCSTPVAKANDSLDTPDVTAVATENGVVVLSWENVKDATGYDVFVKNPGTDAYDALSDAVETSYGNTSVRVIPVYELDKEYSFKVRATHAATNSSNLLNSDFSEVSVTTPEEWKDTAIDAARIEVALEKNTLNKYCVNVPVDAGFKYSVKLVNATGNAKVIYNATAIGSKSVARDVAGASKVAKETTITNAEGEEEDAIAPAYMGTATISITSNSTSYNPGKNVYYAVVKAEPINTQVATTKYAISTASATFNPAAIKVKTNDDVVVTQTGATKARLTFTAPKVQGADVDASKFVVYRAETSNIRTSLQDELGIITTTSYAPVAGLKKDATLSNSTSAVYVLDDTIKAYDQLKAYSYSYYVVAENDAGDVWSNEGTLRVAGNNAWVRSLNKPVIAMARTDNKVNITVSNVDRDAKLEVKYYAFATREAAEAAVNGDLTLAIPVTLRAGQTPAVTTNVSQTTKDGVTTNVTNSQWDTVVYELNNYALDPAQTVTNTYTSDGTLTSSVNDTQTVGKYYVAKAFASVNGCVTAESDVVKIGLQKTVSVTNGVSGTPTWEVIYH